MVPYRNYIIIIPGDKQGTKILGCDVPILKIQYKENDLMLQKKKRTILVTLFGFDFWVWVNPYHDPKISILPICYSSLGLGYKPTDEEDLLKNEQRVRDVKFGPVKEIVPHFSNATLTCPKDGSLLRRLKMLYNKFWARYIVSP